MGPGPLRKAADALRYWELRQQLATNNLANAETPGFKAERAFARLMGAGQSPVIGATTDLSEGAFKPTGNPLDIALVGDTRFFIVETGAGERLIRGGALRLDDDNRLVDAGGRTLLKEGGGAIVVPPGSRLTIGQDGTVAADGVSIGRLRVDRVPGPDFLEHEAAGLFRALDGREPVQDPDRGVRQGMLEDSNVSTLDSMVDLITIQRAYAAVQGGVRTLDGILDTIANRIGRVG
jgi:flagellar basal body rod protein FlgG